MLKLLDDLTNLSVTQVMTENDYRAKLLELKRKVRELFEAEIMLSHLRITATSEGELHIEPAILQIRQGMPIAQAMTISYEDLMRIVAVLQAGVS